MKTLIAVKSCKADAERGCHDAIREGWALWLPSDVELKFFTGHYAERDDEIALDCPDEYINLSYKTRAICEWSVAQEYDFTFLCDNDTFIHPERLLSDTFEWDYKGRFYFQSKIPWAIQGPQFAFGGTGYWLSKHAAKIIAASEPGVYKNEDQFVGRKLWESESVRIRRANMQRWERYAAWHYTKNVYAEYPKYNPKSEWQTKMANHHILGIPQDLATIDLKTFPELPAETVVPQASPLVIVAKMHELYNSSTTPDCLISLGAAIEIQAKPAEAITTIEWEALGKAHFLLGNRAVSEKCYALAKG